ncbi:MAG: O-antigen ligase family protein, partial [Kiritimatiellae bacterium]|nr:O-antigen ligase family protein [Kiritimatiellia bacterium]
RAAPGAPPFRESPAYSCVAAAAFFAGCSLPLARLALVAALVCTVSSRSGRRALVSAARTRPFAGWAVFICVAFAISLAAALTNADPLLVPRRGLGKFDKLLWFGTMAVVASQIRSAERAGKILRAFVLGAAVSAACVLAVNPLGALLESRMPDDYTLYRSQSDPGAMSPVEARIARAAESAGLLDPALYDDLRRRPHRPILSPKAKAAVQAQPLLRWAYRGGWKAGAFGPALAKRGTMAASQRLMLGILAALALALAAFKEGEKARAARWVAATAFLAAALLLTCKRGPLVVLAASLVALLAHCGVSLRRSFAVLAVLAVAALAVPQVRARFSQLPSELSLERGGRARMWCVMAPQLRRERPFGIGFRALTYEKMVDMDCKLTGGKVWVEVGRNHVHCTPLQVLVDLGWIGLAAWAAWMALALRFAASVAKRAKRRGCGPGGGERLAPALAFLPAAFLSVLLAYGLVEYNFADSEIVLLYAFAFGLAIAFSKIGPDRA